VQSQTPEMQQILVRNTITRLPFALVVLVPLYLLLIYILPVIILRFMDTKKFSKGFDFPVIFKKAFTSKYLAAWFVALFVITTLSIAMIILSIILAITIIGIIPLIFVVIPMYIYIIGVYSYGIYGQAYGEVK